MAHNTARATKCLSFFFIVIVAIGCSSVNEPSDVRLGEEFRLRMGQEARVYGTDLIIKFSEVKEDSRCPEGLVCFWAGNARIVITLSRTDLELNTTLEPREEVHSGYTISLRDVFPYPKRGEEVNFEKYVVALIITKN